MRFPFVDNPRQAARMLAQTGILAALYFGAGTLGLSLASINPSASPVWAPTGIALAAFVVLGNSALPGVLLGAFLVNFTTSGAFGTSLAIAVGNTLEGLAGGYLLARFANGRSVFDTPLGVFKFMLLAAMVSTAISATIGVTALSITTPAIWPDIAAIWVTWWFGDLVGALVVAPPLILWNVSTNWFRSPAKILEAGLLVATLALVSFGVFGDLLPVAARKYPLTFVCLPVILWAAFRFSQREAALASILLTAIAIWGTLNGHGPFVTDSQNDSLLLQQSFMAVVVLTALTTGAIVLEREKALAALRGERSSLELRVQERTTELRRSEARFSTAFHRSPLPMAIAALPGGEYLDVNDSFADLVGYSRDQIIGATSVSLNLIGQTERTPLLTSVNQLGAFNSQQVAIRTKSGEVRHILTSSEQIQLEGKPAALSVVLDITERLHAQNALESSEARFRSLIESAPDGIIVSNPQGQIVLANAQIQRLFGYTPEQLVGKKIERLIPRRAAKTHVGHRAAFFAEGGSRQMGADRRILARRKDGSELTVEIGLSVFELDSGPMAISFIRDISERFEQEEALRQSEERFATAFNSSPVAMIITRLPHGLIVDANEAYLHMVGYTRAEALGRTTTELNVIVDQAVRVAAVRELEQKGSLRQFQTLLRHRSGEVRDIVVSASQIQVGGVECQLAVIYDETERKRALQVLEEARSRAEEANRLKTQFVTTLSHELRTPLNAVIGFSDVLLKSTRDKVSPQEQDYLANILSSGEHLLELINELLDFSSIEAGQVKLNPEPFAPESLLTEIREKLRGLAETKGLEFRTVLDPALPLLLTGDSLRLKQILINLTSNAIKFTDQGRVEVRVEKASATTWAIVVTDTGIGIPAEAIDNLFEQFSQVDNSETRRHEGTGLGLAIARELTSLMGGSIMAASELGKGSTFRAELPLITGETTGLDNHP